MSIYLCRKKWIDHDTDYIWPFPSLLSQGSICETRKGPNRTPIRRGIDYFVYARVWKFKAFGQFWPTSGGRNCQKAHLYAKTFFMSLFPGLYDHPLQRNSVEKLKFRKALFWTFWPNSAISGGRIWPKLSKGTSTGQTFHMSL